MANDFYVDILEPKQDPEESVRLASTVLAPLYQKCWQEEQEPHYGKPFDLHAQLFLDLWFTGGSKIFLARERSGENKPIGFLIGMLFRPIQYNAHVFQVQDWYAGGRADVEQELFDHVVSALRFIGCDEVWVGRSMKPVPSLGDSWKKANDFSITRYVKAE